MYKENNKENKLFTIKNKSKNNYERLIYGIILYIYLLLRNNNLYVL